MQILYRNGTNTSWVNSDGLNEEEIMKITPDWMNKIPVLTLASVLQKNDDMGMKPVQSMVTMETHI